MTPSTHIVGVLDANFEIAFSPLRATFRTERGLIWGTGFIHSAVVLKEKTIEETPTAMTALIQKVAVHTMLHRELDILSEPNLDTRL